MEFSIFNLITRIICLAIVFLCGASSGYAQELHSFPDTATTWVNCIYKWDGPGGTGPANYHMSDAEMFELAGNDTIIDTLSYSLLHRNSSYFGAIREDSGKVYFYPKDSVQEYLIYDFSLGVGDTAEIYVTRFSPTTEFQSNTLKVVVLNTDSTEIEGTYHKTLAVTYYNSRVGRWIAGIGEQDGLMCPEGNSIENTQSTMYCLSVAGNSIFPAQYTGACATPTNVGFQEQVKSTMMVYPNPASQHVTIELGSARVDIHLFNQVGQVVWSASNQSGRININTSGFRAGIYYAKATSSTDISTQKILISDSL